jgi:hypothetical protein
MKTHVKKEITEKEVAPIIKSSLVETTNALMLSQPAAGPGQQPPAQPAASDQPDSLVELALHRAPRGSQRPAVRWPKHI